MSKSETLEFVKNLYFNENYSLMHILDILYDKAFNKGYEECSYRCAKENEKEFDV